MTPKISALAARRGEKTIVDHGKVCRGCSRPLPTRKRRGPAFCRDCRGTPAQVDLTVKNSGAETAA
jgi:hypothetical protein